MKREINLLVIALVVVAFSGSVFAQIKLDTGYNPSNLTYGNYNQKDNYWILKKKLGVGVAQQSDIIVPNGSWKIDLAPAKWINANPSNSNSQNGEYEFQRCFCLKKGFKEANLNFRLRADDYASVLLNGNQITQTIPKYSFKAAKPTTVFEKEQKYFRVGRNCLTVKLKNIWGVASGFALNGQVSAIGLDGDAIGIKQSYSKCSSCAIGRNIGRERPKVRKSIRGKRN